ncbi:MAG: glycosyltransferase, partial [Dehalococcoidia bacterium]|nr:glycosyltransferase [Dehalococcoidia bacterium]
MPEPYLSVIIPAYNEARRIGPTLQKVQAYLASRQLDAEILLADDGSTDDTLAVAEHARATDL